jgi:hypothetical protein
MHFGEYLFRIKRHLFHVDGQQRKIAECFGEEKSSVALGHALELEGLFGWAELSKLPRYEPLGPSSQGDSVKPVER